MQIRVLQYSRPSIIRRPDLADVAGVETRNPSVKAKNTAALLFRDVEDAVADGELLTITTQLIDRKTGPFRAEAFKDHFDQAQRELIGAKRKNSKAPRALVGEDHDRPKGGSVVELMEALPQSLKANPKPAVRPKGGTAAKSRRKAS